MTNDVSGFRLSGRSSEIYNVAICYSVDSIYPVLNTEPPLSVHRFTEK